MMHMSSKTLAFIIKIIITVIELPSTIIGKHASSHGIHLYASLLEIDFRYAGFRNPRSPTREAIYNGAHPTSLSTEA